jgi:hypothetical protein
MPHRPISTPIDTGNEQPNGRLLRHRIFGFDWVPCPVLALPVVLSLIRRRRRSLAFPPCLNSTQTCSAARGRRWWPWEAPAVQTPKRRKHFRLRARCVVSVAKGTTLSPSPQTLSQHPLPTSTGRIYRSVGCLAGCARVAVPPSTKSRAIGSARASGPRPGHLQPHSRCVLQPPSGTALTPPLAVQRHLQTSADTHSSYCSSLSPSSGTVSSISLLTVSLDERR